MEKMWKQVKNNNYSNRSCDNYKKLVIYLMGKTQKYFLKKNRGAFLRNVCWQFIATILSITQAVGVKLSAGS